MKIKLTKYYYKVMEDHEKIKIEEVLLHRNMDLKDNPKWFFNLVLSRSKDRITFDKLIYEEIDGLINIVTNWIEIEMIVIDHY